MLFVAWMEQTLGNFQNRGNLKHVFIGAADPREFPNGIHLKTYSGVSIQVGVNSVAVASEGKIPGDS